MDMTIVSILTALTVGLLVMGGVQVAAALTDGEKRKLKQRLSSESRPGAGSAAANRSILLQQQDPGALGGGSPAPPLRLRSVYLFDDQESLVDEQRLTMGKHAFYKVRRLFDSQRVSDRHVALFEEAVLS